MIYLTGDTHGHIDINKLSNKNNAIMKLLSKNDYLIILGDFGLVWHDTPQERYWLNWLNNKPWTTLFVDGNHENFDRLKTEFETEDWAGGKITKIRDKIFHLQRGYIFNIENQNFLAIGGASSHDIEYRTEFISWWKDENISTADFNNALNNIKYINDSGQNVDYVLSHDCPSECLESVYVFDKNTSSSNNIALSEINSILKDQYKKWYFGHHHCNKSFGNFCCLYNRIIKIGEKL